MLQIIDLVFSIKKLGLTSGLISFKLREPNVVNSWSWNTKQFIHFGVLRAHSASLIPRVLFNLFNLWFGSTFHGESWNHSSQWEISLKSTFLDLPSLRTCARTKPCLITQHTQIRDNLVEITERLVSSDQRYQQQSKRHDNASSLIKNTVNVLSYQQDINTGWI